VIPLDRLPPARPQWWYDSRGSGGGPTPYRTGLNPGSEIQNLQNWGRGPLIVEVHGARLALGRGQAARVVVEPLTR